jgi:ribosomal protein L10
MAGGAEVRAKKNAQIEKLYELFGTHKQIILANFTNVGSDQIQQIRKTLRSFNGTLVIAKNVLIILISDSHQKNHQTQSLRHPRLIIHQP